MMKSTTNQNIARAVAVLAIAVSGILLIVIFSSSGSDSSSDEPRPNAEGRQAGQQRGAQEQQRRRPAQYVVQSGDTLTSISEKTGVSVNRIEALNPTIDPQILNAGDRLRLR